MVAVISDLHFEEEAADVLHGDDGQTFSLTRNVPCEVFRSMTADLLAMARANGASKIVLVLAGDVFDLNRTQLWFSGAEGLGPWVSCADVEADAALEAKLQAILDSIVAETRVRDSLDVLVRFAQGQAFDQYGACGQTGLDCELVYLPGNHDRLLNATPALRRRVRQILHLPDSDAPFDHQLALIDPPVLIRHGHEYDRLNFGVDLSHGTIETVIPPANYEQPCFGDVVTVMIASRLPHLFRELHGASGGDHAILRDPLLRLIYCRLLQFDDVRPQSAVVDYFLKTRIPEQLESAADPRAWKRTIWTPLEPVVRQVLDEAAGHRFFMAQFERLFPVWLNWFVRLRPWRFGIPLWAVELFAWLKSRPRQSESTCTALRERALQQGAVQFVCSGHTHNPRVLHVSTVHERKTFFVDTGTCRNTVLTAADNRSYGRVNAATYVAFYGTREGDLESVERAFEFWTGFDQSWPVDQYDR